MTRTMRPARSLRRPLRRLATYLLIHAAAAADECRAGNEPNPPIWPASVRVFEPHDGPNIARVVARFADRDEDSPERSALLFKPGLYEDADVGVGCYTEVLGLGEQADDVAFVGERTLHALDSCDGHWRSAANLRVAGDLHWRAGDSASLRRVRVGGDWVGASGFAADVIVDGAATADARQSQWFARNSRFNATLGGRVQVCLVGCVGGEAHSIPQRMGRAVLRVEAAPLVAAKPYLTLGADGLYTLQIPDVVANATDAFLGPQKGRAVPLNDVFVAKPSDARDGTLHAKLAAGLHVILTPGVYELDDPLDLDHRGQTLLGLGFATVVAPPDGAPALRVSAKTPGVRVAGVIFEAHAVAPRGRTTLVEWGDEGATDAGDANDPGVLSDVSARLRHATSSLATVVRIHASKGIGDNLRILRCDALQGGAQATEATNVAHVGLEVLGADVTLYHVAVEHLLSDQVRWTGEGGSLFSASLTLPRDATQARYASHGFSGLVVAAPVRRHASIGVVVRAAFREAVFVLTALQTSVSQNVTVLAPTAVHEEGPGGILSVINGEGAASGAAKRIARWP
ncbi:hypothetical protein M885DRAFT_527207 [Pelagophyceae sp. CCMP2097]|nr:hypothetical protein M885DRAFT_527207 [Pelagophyceae sp. CCMP2097]